MLAGAALAGRCLLNAGMGVHHGLAQLVGGRTGIPHGLANAILLTHAVAFNAVAVPEEVEQIGVALGVGRCRGGDRPAARSRSACPAASPRWVSTEDDLEAIARLSQANAQRGPQPAPGLRGRRPRHPPSRLVVPAAG